MDCARGLVDDLPGTFDRSVPFMFSLGSVLPNGFRVCAEFSCSKLSTQRTDNKSICSGHDGMQVADESGAYTIPVPLVPGNCTVAAAVFNEDGAAITGMQGSTKQSNRFSCDMLTKGLLAAVWQRRFRVSDEQEECPPESGVACIHGECSGQVRMRIWV